jgi:dolichyl-phosphate-mannose-protein mannosyltransferase
MKSFLKNNWQPVILSALAFLTRFLFLTYPGEVVFDELYFWGYVKSYFTHQYYFDVHPPLGKLLVYFFSFLFGLPNMISPTAIGQALNASDILILRFLPAFFGALLVILFYFLILKMGFSKKAAFLGSAMVLLDNAILVQSKFTLIDIFQLFFGFFSLYLLLYFANAPAGSKKSYYFLMLATIFATLAFCIKWTGLSFLAIVGLFFLADALKNFNKKRVATNLLIIVVLPVLIYFCIFAVHFALLAKSGPGNAFMSPAFQNVLAGGPNAPKLTLPEKFVELNQKMYFYTLTIKNSHPFSSKWYQWPLDKKPILYWSKLSKNSSSRIYLIGNPAVWWPAVLAVAASIVLLPFSFFRKKLPRIFYILIFGYFLNLLPFIFINRTTFVYAYFSSLLFGILILAALYDTFLKDKPGFHIFYYGFLCLILLYFLIILPLTYGIPLPLNVSNHYSNFIGFFYQ